MENSHNSAGNSGETLSNDGLQAGELGQAPSATFLQTGLHEDSCGILYSFR